MFLIFGLLPPDSVASGSTKTAPIKATPSKAPLSAATPISSKPEPSPAPTVNIIIVPAKSANGRISDAQKEYCNLVWGCGLPVPDGFCPDRSSIEKPKFAYDSTRCLEARILNLRGIGPGHPLLGFRIYRFLGMEYRVVYNVEEDLPISEARLAFLLAELPLAAHLMRYFQKEPYTAVYVDAERKHFQGTKGSYLKGDATLISGSSDEKRLFYFGYGTATVAWWTLKGPALMDFTYSPSTTKPNNLRYRMKLLVFPGNGIINGIMNLGLFKKIVLGKIKEVLEDITKTAQKLAVTPRDELLKNKDWSPEEKQKIEAFLKLP